MDDIVLRLTPMVDAMRPSDIEEMVAAVRKLVAEHGYKVLIWGNQEQMTKALLDEQTFVMELLSAAVQAERERCAELCESMGALDALDGEEVGSAAMVRVADRQATLCAAAIRSPNKVETVTLTAAAA